MYVVLYSVYISSNFSTWFEFQTFPILSRWPPFGGDHVLWKSPPIWSYGPPGQVPISINHLSVWGPGHFFYSYGSPPKHLGHSSPLGEINDAGISLWIPNIQWKAGWSQDLSASHGWMESSDLIDSNKGSIIQLIPIEIERIVWLPVQLLYLV